MIAPARNIASLLFSLLLLCSCEVGPDFERPEAPATERYTADPLPAATASAPVEKGEAQRFQACRDIPAEWWNLFHSTALDALIKDAPFFPHVLDQGAKSLANCDAPFLA